MKRWLIALLLLVVPVMALANWLYLPGPGYSRSGGGSSGPVEVATDDFSSYAHATQLGNTANWDAVLGVMLTLSNDTVRGNTSGALTACNWVGDTYQANQYATTTAGAINTGTSLGGPAVRARMSGSSNPQFYALVANGGNTIKLYSYNGDSGTPTTEIDSYSQSISVSGKLKLEVTGTGSSIRLAAYYDADGLSGWTALATDVDPVDEFDSGSAGVAYWGNQDTARITAWSGGNL